MESIFSAIVTPGMAGLAAAAIALMLFFGRIPYKGSRINQTKFWKNWGEFVLVAICIAGAFAPGVSDLPYERWGGLLVFAAVSALVAHLGRKILKPFIISQLEGKSSVESKTEDSNEN
jgi:hypothetical protein